MDGTGRSVRDNTAVDMDEKVYIVPSLTDIIESSFV